MTNKKLNIKIPDYYIGKIYGYEARKVVEDFNLNYNIGSTVTYLLRANNKHETPKECIKKAINHLYFELERIENIENKNIYPRSGALISGGKL
ncbi:MAG: hypothetical protein Tp178DCM178821_37 [Prokaryotic dsDNA virus sp.]|nr:MAG: hypothetical protein Tp178DCM178821_37 [Prokaryotic dsDNA virus sp.]|tara:strand:+ start:4179 stop:4457 length:279 start_codon:yes stop_codon:yes gene_type:complete